MDQLADRRYAERYPDLSREPIPVEPSCSPEWFEKEREAIFKRSWLNVGRVEELPAPGDYLVKPMAVWNASVLLIHGRDGKIRAFHNVCTHRGNLLLQDGVGKCRGFITCPFHGWVFDDVGRLAEITDETNFYDPDRNQLGLRSIATDVWNGFVFVNLNPQQSLHEYLGELADSKMSAYPFADLTTRFTYMADERVNWKVLLDAQQEGYHVPFLHRRTLSLSFPESLVKFRSQSLEVMGPHRLLATAASTEPFSPTPTGRVAMKFGPTSLEAFAGGGDGGGFAAAMEGVFDFQVVFPNFVIALLYGTYFTYNIWPIAADRSMWEIRMYYPKPSNAGQAFSNEYGKIGLRDGLLEDGSTHERTQIGIQSGAIKAFQFQDEEMACRHGHLTVMDMVRSWEQGKEAGR